eukprot:CAMPEP_0198499040 /NCGR_PEP_ID=MMETSP1462-20131121/7374_1 /TAXON_ID=1333877 /ORGANISM="Brandtodinium nutriculum, Strain RCC3387" /LENGTH=71 /DNA_ID=CAMNT_0044227997 /DNA_START=126 /DNA_END=341 /DNA_ORIENTATION=+
MASASAEPRQTPSTQRCFRVATVRVCAKACKRRSATVHWQDMKQKLWAAASTKWRTGATQPHDRVRPVGQV